MHVNETQFLSNISGFLGSFYLLLAVMNGIAAYYCWEKLKKNTLALWMLVLSFVFLVISPIAFSGKKVADAIH